MFTLTENCADVEVIGIAFSFSTPIFSLLIETRISSLPKMPQDNIFLF